MNRIHLWPALLVLAGASFALPALGQTPQPYGTVYNRDNEAAETIAPQASAEIQVRNLPTDRPEPTIGLIRSRETLLQFLGNPRAADEMVTHRVERGNAGEPPRNYVVLNGTPAIRTGEFMLAAIHLGSKGSKGYGVEIFEVTRTQRQGQKGLLTIKYRITGGDGGDSDFSIDRADGFGGGVAQQQDAPSSFVRLPWLHASQNEVRFELYVEGSEGYFPGGLTGVGLGVRGDPTVELPFLFVNTWGVIQGGGERKARALVSEMMRLRRAVIEARPRSVTGVDPSSAPEDTALLHDAEFKLATVAGERRRPTERTGSWEGVADRLEPVRQALKLIHLRLTGQLDIEDIERLAGRLPVDDISLTVTPSFEGDYGVNIRIDNTGLVYTSGDPKPLTEPEIDHLVWVLEQTNPMAIEAPNGVFDFPGGRTNFVSVPGARGTRFALQVRKDGEVNDLAGYLEAAGPAVAAIQQSLELVAARVLSRPARVSGNVRVVGENALELEGLFLTFKTDERAAVAGNTLGAVQKIKEWAGRFVEIWARARITTRESVVMAPNRISYPQYATISGVVNGNRLAYMEAGNAQGETTLDVDLVGSRAGALVAGQNGRFVTLKGWLFYNEAFQPGEAFVEAIEVVISRRPDRPLFDWSVLNGDVDTGRVVLHSRPSHSSTPTNSIFVGPLEAKAYWITNRQSGWSLIPVVGQGQQNLAWLSDELGWVLLPVADTRGRGGWAKENSDAFHLGEDPDEVDDDMRRGALDIFRDVAADVLLGEGGALSGGGQ